MTRKTWFSWVAAGMLGLAAGVSGAAPSVTVASSAPVADTVQGKVTGITRTLPGTDLAADAFLGIPYAEPPGRRSPLETRGSREKLDWCPERRVARGAVPAARRGIGRLPLRRYLPPGRHEVGREASGCRVSPWRREYHGKRFSAGSVAARGGIRCDRGGGPVSAWGAWGSCRSPNSGKPRGTSRSPISRKRSAG